MEFVSTRGSRTRAGSRPTVVTVTDRSSIRVPRIGDVLPLPLQVSMRYAIPLFIALQTFTHFGKVAGGHRPLVVGLFAIVAIAWVVIPTRRSGDRWDQLLMVVSIGASAGLGVLTGAGQVFAVAYASLFVGPFWYGMPQATGPYVAGVLGVGLSTAFVGNRDLLGGVGNAFGAAFFGLAALFWGRVLRASERNAELVDELRDSREAEARSAVVAERARLARELHDVLAHTLSSLSLHLESTRVLGKARDVDAEVLDRIDRAVSLARTGLEEARDAVATLRDDALPGPERLPALVDEFARTAGVDCHFEQTGTPTALTPEARVALFRSAQEALTNIGKHARCSRVAVCLEWNADGVRLRVADDGRGPATGDGMPGGGNGLRGMRERAELAGGHLQAGPTADGFVVDLLLPA